MTIPHLDEEALSAALDDEGSAAEMAHLAGCRRCQAGVARLGELSRAVAIPVPPRSENEVTASIQQALRSQPAPASGLASIPPIAGMPPGPGPGPGPGPVRGSRPPPGRTRIEPRRWVVAAASIAAAVVVVAAVVGLSRSSGPSRRVTTSATAAAASAPSAALGGGEAATTAPAANRTELGDQSDPATLARSLRALLNQPVAAQASPPLPDLAKGSPAPATTDPVAQCTDQARVAAGATGPPALTASLRWQGQSAVVLVYNRPAGRLAAVMRTADCSRLALVPL